MKRIIAALLCAVILVSLCACDSLSNLFVGVNGSQWALTGMTDNCVEIDYAYLQQSGVTGSIAFEKETFTIELQGNTFEGTYILNGAELTLTIGEETVSATCNDGIITMVIDGATLIFTEQ